MTRGTALSQAGQEAGLIAGVEPVPVGEWSARKYLLVLFGMGIPAALVVWLGILTGQAAVAGIIVALPFGILVAMRPEIGVFLIALYVPFEAYGIIGAGLATVTKILGIYTALMLVPRLVVGRRGNIGIPAFWLALAFATWSMLTVLVAQDPQWAWMNTLTRFQLVFLVFVVLNACATKEQFKTLCWVLFLAAVGASVAAFFVTPRELEVVHRVTVGDINVNEHAKNLIGGILVAPFLMSRRSPWARLFIGVGLLVMLVGMVMTVSRSNYIALFVGLMVAVAVYRRFSIPRRTLLAVSVVVLLALFAFIGFASGMFGAVIGDRFADLWERGLEAGGRIRMYRAAAQMGIEHPLMGIGIGQFVYEFMEYGFYARSVHNDVLTHFAETGFPGLALYAVFMIAVLRGAWRVTDPGLRAVLIGLFAAAFVSSLANPSYNVKAFWLQMSLCILGGAAFAPAPAGAEPASNSLLNWTDGRQVGGPGNVGEP